MPTVFHRNTLAGAEVRERRLQHETSLEELAALAGVSTRTLWSWEHDETQPTRGTVALVTHALQALDQTAEPAT